MDSSVCQFGYSARGITVLDVNLNKSFKDHINQKIMEENKEKIDNPDKDLVLQWVLSSLDNLKPDLIQQSFKYCGCTINLDNSEQHLLNRKLKQVSLIQLQLNEDMLKEKKDDQ